MKIVAFVLFVLCVTYINRSNATRWMLPQTLSQRMTRQVGAGRYGVAGPNYGGGAGGGSGGGGIPNGYRPLPSYNNNIRSSIQQSIVGAKPGGNIPNQNTRSGVGAITFGGMASGRPVFGPNNGINPAIGSIAGVGVGRPQTRPLQNRVYSYNGGAAAAAATSGGSRPTAFRYH